MKIRTATAEDIAEVVKTSISRGIERESLPPAVYFEWAVEHDGVVLAVGGMQLLRPTTGLIWFDWAAAALAHKKTMYKMLGEWIGCCAKAHDLRRLMAVVECDFKEAVRTVEHLGFKLEATLPMFFGEEPGYLYTMLISKEVSQWQG